MSQQVLLKVVESDVDPGYKKLIQRAKRSDDHLVVESDGSPQVVVMSIQEYEKLGQKNGEETIPSQTLPPVLSLEEAFGSVTPLNRPEDFQAIREIAIEEHVAKQTE